MALRITSRPINKGLLKIFSKMGISTLQSYRGAQVFEAIGLNKKLVDKYFTGTASPHRRRRARRARRRSRFASTSTPSARSPSPIPNWRSAATISSASRGEYHLYNPQTIAKLQHAVRQESFADVPGIHGPDRQRRTAQLCTLRGLLEFKTAGEAGAARGSRAGQGDRQALRHRRHVVRLHLARKRTRRWPSP